ncbi:ATP-dependent zinc protease [Roseivirga sp. BDSF3-8]|uniref:ATP-dependent zinc protease family protein n=1 Tax=Roseivirga sp. BDSF3-8 TaxID=3241598 RepID=UPI0035319053
MTIGRKDTIDFPDFQIHDLDAKVDTGAYTSSLHCSRIKKEREGAKEVLTFYLSGHSLHEKKARKFSTTDFIQKNIKSSNGQIENRYVIRTHVTLFGRTFKAEFSLADRSSMKNPVLLGRKLLAGRYIVDVTKKDLSKKLKNQTS